MKGVYLDGVDEIYFLTEHSIALFINAVCVGIWGVVHLFNLLAKRFQHNGERKDYCKEIAFKYLIDQNRRTIFNLITTAKV